MKLIKWDTNRLEAGSGKSFRDGLSHTIRWTFYYVCVGVFAGIGSIVFYYLCQLGMRIFLDFLAGYRPPSSVGEYALFIPGSGEFSRWVLLILPACGGLLSGWLVYKFAPEAAGAGNDAAIHAYHYTEGFIRARVPGIKTLATVITLTTGGSGGREGPIAQIGAGIGSLLATKLKLSARERRILMAAGIAAGVGSIFSSQVWRRIDSPAHSGEFFVDVLQTITVKDVLGRVQKVIMIPESMPFADFKKHFSETERHYFPVMDQEEKLTRIFSVNDVRSVLFAPGIGQLVVMKDIGTSEIITTSPSEDLNSVLKKFTVKNIDSLPVVRDDDARELIGMLNRREVIAYYNQRVQEMKSRSPSG